jgi:hypothetical protein
MSGKPDLAESQVAGDLLGPADADRLRTAVRWRLSDWGLAEWFIVSQTLLPALLFVPGTQVIRLPLRVASFGMSVAILVWLRLVRNLPIVPPHPARPWLLGLLVYMGVMILHPTTNSLSGGAAQIALYYCVMSPLFWAPYLVKSPEHLRRLVVLMLVTNGLNAMVGVLQVYDPDTWLPEEFSRIVTESRYGLAPVSYVGPGGVRIIRPPGLFDTPGAVAGPGMFATLLGLIFAASPIWIGFRLSAGTLAMAGVMAIYLSQVRISLVVLLAMLVAYLLTLLAQRRTGRAIIFSAMLSLSVALGLTTASLLGGQGIIDRVLTLFQDDPFALYYASRGNQLVYAFTDLVTEAPLGSGLGRWGMAAMYFSDPTNRNSPPIWAEIQLSGWMIDGGLVLVFAYAMALVLTALHEWRIATEAADDWVRASGAVVFAANLGAAALVFSFTPFVSQFGTQYWFLAGALHGLARQYHDRMQ